MNFSDNKNTEKRLPLLDLLLKASEDEKILSNQDIRNEIDTFMAGVLFALFINYRVCGFN
jgi:cytochrome P450